jgi:serine/threonine-protein kinase
MNDPTRKGDVGNADDTSPTTVSPTPLAESAAPSAIRARVASPRYRRLAQLGAGGRGAVFLSRDVTLQRDVAIKTASASQGNDSMLAAAIDREAVIQARLEHPAIPPVYDVGVDDDGASFFTMRKIEGVSLNTVLRRLTEAEPTFMERFGQRRLLAAFSTVCAAVAFAHSKSVLHRDVKPSNIMFGQFGEVYLLDFGVAKLPAGPEEPWHEGDLLGTLGYVAPEQARGDPVDEHADVYALGAVLFEILTHERLHEREPHLALRTTLQGVDVRAKARRSRIDVPPELEELCVRATALEPADRIPSAMKLHEAIERYLDGERDLARRRALAREYAQVASDNLLKAAEDGARGAALRDEALEAANRALALEPGNVVATQVLAQLATTTRPGPDAERSQRQATLGLRRLLVRVAIALFVLWVSVLGSAALLGIRSWSTAIAATLAATVAAILIAIRSRTDATWARVAAFTAGLVTASFTTAMFGPFILLPSYLACFGVLALTSTLPATAASRTEPRRLRAFFMVSVVFTMLVPMALEWLGIVPASMLFRDNTIVFVPRAVNFPPVPTMLFLLVGNAIVVLLPAIIAARVHDYALEVERRAFEAASMLSQLVPRPARTAASVRSDGPRSAEAAEPPR